MDAIETYFMVRAILRHEIITHNSIHCSAKASCSIPNALRCINLNEFLGVGEMDEKKSSSERKLRNSILILNHFRYFQRGKKVGKRDESVFDKLNGKIHYFWIPCDCNRNLLQNYSHIHPWSSYFQTRHLYWDGKLLLCGEHLNLPTNILECELLVLYEHFQSMWTRLDWLEWTRS